MDASEHEVLWAERAITRVILAYARAVDALDFERLRACFHPDARLHYGDYFSGGLDEAMAWLERSLTRLQATLHDFGAPWIELDLARGRARCETCTTNAARFPVDEQGQVVLNVTGTRYLDLFERRGGEWRIVERRNLVTWAQNSFETPTPPPPLAGGRPLRR